jgi:hypothetical protein
MLLIHTWLVTHVPTGDTRIRRAESAEMAVQSTGWAIADCTVEQILSGSAAD